MSRRGSAGAKAGGQLVEGKRWSGDLEHRAPAIGVGDRAAHSGGDIGHGGEADRVLTASEDQQPTRSTVLRRSGS
jgi:hypothetical protein